MADGKQKIFWLILILANLVLIGMFVLAGFSKHDFSVNQKENSHLIGVSYMTMNNEFYEIMSEEINAEVDRAVNEIIAGEANVSTELIIWNREINRKLNNNE